MTDPIADMLTRIRNANQNHAKTVTMPSSKMKETIASILKEEGYIVDYSIEENDVQNNLTLTLKYGKNKEVTFTYLIQLYNIEHSFNKDEYNVSDFDFKDYEYVKEFIAFIAMLQIKNGGKHLSSDKILTAVNDFIILKKNKPKKRIKK